MIGAFKAVFWSFFGIRRQKEYDDDARKRDERVRHVLDACGSREQAGHALVEADRRQAGPVGE